MRAAPRRSKLQTRSPRREPDDGVTARQPLRASHSDPPEIRHARMSALVAPSRDYPASINHADCLYIPRGTNGKKFPTMCMKYKSAFLFLFNNRSSFLSIVVLCKYFIRDTPPMQIGRILLPHGGNCSLKTNRPEAVPNSSSARIDIRCSLESSLI